MPEVVESDSPHAGVLDHGMQVLDHAQTGARNGATVKTGECRPSGAPVRGVITGCSLPREAPQTMSKTPGKP